MAIDNSRINGAFEFPDKLLIVGIDDQELGASGRKDADDLWDADRIDRPAEGLVESILVHGVKVPVVVRARRAKKDGKDQTQYIVVDGRQRVMAARIAHAKLLAKGDDVGIRVPYIIREGDQSFVVVANEWRRDDPVWVKARKAKALEQRGAELPEILSAFSDGQGHIISKQTLGNWKSLLRVTPEIMDRIKSGELSVTIGYELGKFKPDEQIKALSHIQERQGSLQGSNGVANVKAAVAATSAAVAATSAPTPPPEPSSPKTQADPALTPRREHVAPAPPDSSPVIVKDARLSSRYLETMAEILAPTPAEPHENEEQKLAYAVFAYASGREGISVLEEFPWLHKLAKRYTPKKKKGAA